MIFPMWPEVYLKQMKRYQGAKREIWCFICAGILSAALYMLFSWDVMLILICLSAIFAWISWWGGKQCRKNSLWRIRFGESSIDLIDHADDVLQSAEYRHVRRVEARRLRLVRGRGGRGPEEAPLECRLIMIYFNATCCFEDLKAAEYRFSRKDEEPHYACGDIFFHRGCIAFAYDEAAWNYLQLQID